MPLKVVYGYGATNIFSSFFSCFPAPGSLSRMPIMNNCGRKSQVNISKKGVKKIKFLIFLKFEFFQWIKKIFFEQFF